MTKYMNRAGARADPFGLPAQSSPFTALRTGFDGVEVPVTVRESARSYNFEVWGPVVKGPAPKAPKALLVEPSTPTPLATLTPREADTLRRTKTLTLGRSRYVYVGVVSVAAKSKFAKTKAKPALTASPPPPPVAVEST